MDYYIIIVCVLVLALKSEAYFKALSKIGERAFHTRSLGKSLLVPCLLQEILTKCTDLSYLLCFSHLLIKVQFITLTSSVSQMAFNV